MRFLTKRYIGEYDHQSDTRYKNEVLVDGDPVIFEICDLCPRSIEDLPSTESLGWADGVVLVYSITERNSFNFIKQVWNIFQVSSIYISVQEVEDFIRPNQSLSKYPFGLQRY